MAGATGLRWRKAMIISLVFHSIILTGAGWLTARALLPVEIPETIIELELASEPEGAPLLAAPAAAAAPVQTSQPVTVSVPTPVIPQVQRQTQPEVVVPEPAAVVVSSMTVVSIDSSAAGQAAAMGGGGAGAAGSGSGTGGNQSGTDQGTISPSILLGNEPPYPEKARRERQEGTVVLQIEILENGRANQVRVKESSGYPLLDDTAATSVRSWRFVPAKIRATGKAIACFTNLPIKFKLK